MVVDTEYYDALQVAPTATELEIKKAYRKMAVKLHPDKNPGDEEANHRFQVIGEAYQVLSDPQLRAAYDKHGKEKAVPSSGFEDPSEFFGMIFGGEAFVDWIGEISLMKDMTKTMDITTREKEQQEAEEAAAARASQQQQNIHGAPTTGTSAATAATTPPKDHTTETPSAQAYTQGQTAAAGPDSTSTTTAPPPYTSGQPGAPPSQPTDTKPDIANPYSQERPKGIPTRPALMEKSEEEARLDAAGVTEEEKLLREREKRKGGLSKEQREELRQFELERQRVRDERVETLAQKLVDRMSVWTETDKGPDVTKAFTEKIRLEIENLKMESFGLEILHAVGAIYLSKGSGMLKSHKGFLGIGGFWSRLKDKGAMAKETWGTISTAIDAQMSMEEMAKAEERGGEDWTDERRAEHEKRVTGKILAAAWRGSKFEIQSVLRDVCDKVLNDKRVKNEKRLERAEALVLMGDMLRKAQRDPDEEGDFLVFEQLMAEAQVKRDKKEEKKKKDSSRHFGFGGGSSGHQQQQQQHSEKPAAAATA